MVYHPRFEGRERYGFTAFSVPCPGLDSALLDLQRFPERYDMCVRRCWGRGWGGRGQERKGDIIGYFFQGRNPHLASFTEAVL